MARRKVWLLLVAVLVEDEAHGEAGPLLLLLERAQVVGDDARAASARRGRGSRPSCRGSAPRGRAGCRGARSGRRRRWPRARRSRRVAGDRSSGAAWTASSWSRASTGSMVTRSRARRSVRPASRGGSSLWVSASTACGNSSGMPCACTAIRLILRWSCGLPSVSATRACGTPKRCVAVSSKRTRSPVLAPPSSPAAIGHSFSSLRSTGSMRPPPPALARKMPSRRRCSRGRRLMGSAS